jgi:hypothetical protein
VDTALCISGVMLDIVGSIGVLMSIYVFWDEAIQRNGRWMYVLVGPPLAAAACWAGAPLLLAAGARYIPADWSALARVFTIASQLQVILGWLFWIAIPAAWLVCAVMCWGVVRRSVLSWVLSLCAIGAGIGMYAGFEMLCRKSRADTHRLGCRSNRNESLARQSVPKSARPYVPVLRSAARESVPSLRSQLAA